MNKDQQVNDGWLEADHMRLDYRNFTDDEEVTLLPHRRDTDVPDNPGSDIRDGPDTSDQHGIPAPLLSRKQQILLKR